MRCLQGIVVDAWLDGLVQVKLQTSGHTFWARSESKCRVRQKVLVAWDYVHDEPQHIFTEVEWNVIQGNRSTETGDFSVPAFHEVGEGEDIEVTPDEETDEEDY